MKDDRENNQSRAPILLTGATGYVGGRLLKTLEAAGQHIRCLARRPEFLQRRVGQQTEVLQGDLLNKQSLLPAMKDAKVAYYMVHSMGSAGAFEEEDRLAAQNFAEAARECGLQRIIYLGGLGNRNAPLSPHLKSRHEVGDILRASGIQTVEFRASIIIGSGSLSFEMIRDLVERLPVMVTPRWVSVDAQPISILDVLSYLEAALDAPLNSNPVFEIGGTDRVSYGDLMREYARQRGLKRLMIPVPVLTPRLSSLWLALVTPLYARIGRKLIDSIRHSTVVQDDAARQVFDISPRGVSESIALSLRNEDREFAETRWSDALSFSGRIRSWGGVKFGNRIVDSRSMQTPAPGNAAFSAISRIGGQTGWYYANWLWGIRGWIDRLFGGSGLRRGRRHPEMLVPGDTLDFWRVEAIEPGRLLRLFAEMKLPGRAWLQFEVETQDNGSIIHQTAIFDPIGISGLLYWYALYPVHGLVFSGMLRGVAKAAESHRACSM